LPTPQDSLEPEPYYECLPHDRPIGRQQSNGLGSLLATALSLGHSQSHYRYRSQIGSISYPLWTTAGKYIDPEVDYYEHKCHEQVVNKLKKRVNELNVELVPQPVIAG